MRGEPASVLCPCVCVRCERVVFVDVVRVCSMKMKKKKWKRQDKVVAKSLKNQTPERLMWSNPLAKHLASVRFEAKSNSEHESVTLPSTS